MTMDSSTEQQHLEAIAADSWYAKGINTATVRYSFEIFKRHLAGNTVLEMGPAEGVMTELLAGVGKHLTLVEGSGLFCEDLKRRFPQANVVCSLFENFQPQDGFDNIVLGHVLEHVLDPVDILSRAKRWLNPSGKVLAAVPNARSRHRQAATIMGMLPFEEALNQTDHHHGHRRVFNPETFRSTFTRAGLRIEIFGGYWLKPLSNAQIEATWSTEMVQAFMSLGERYPDVAGELYIVAAR